MSLPHGGVDRNYDAAGDVLPRKVAPSRGRGSKPRNTSVASGLFSRSLTGAWIETCFFAPDKPVEESRSLTGAWIETPDCANRKRLMLVAPSRGRGSKQTVRHIAGQNSASLPHGGVDRNRPSTCCAKPMASSLPHGGVDRNFAAGIGKAQRIVAPSRGRGSKPAVDQARFAPACRSLTGAWIETRLACEPPEISMSLPHGGVDRNS